MKNSFPVSAVGIAFLALLVAGCTAPLSGGAAPSVATTTPVVTTIPVASFSCGFTSCHGLDLACGRNPPQVCTALYQLGDKCRQYAYCTDTGGSCTLVRTSAFDTCKSCIEKCGGADAAEVFTCEEKC